MCLFCRKTDKQGQCEFLKGSSLPPEIYRLHFDTDVYFKSQNSKGFFPYIEVRMIILSSLCTSFIKMILST